MTREHGRHLGLGRGGFGARLKPVLQVGNSVSATWRARLDEHLGNFTVEGLKLRAANFFAAPHAIYGVSHLAALMRLLPERDPHAGLYGEFDDILNRLDDPALAAPLVVRFELQLLSELGFGLDLEQCAATGASADLIYVSPKSGRAVSRDAGAPWAEKMLRLPAFLRDRGTQPAGRDLADGFALTGFFLARHVLEPRGLKLSDERAHFIAALARALPSVA
jgi:DNA repair protein RecO (recombination protein O)